MPCCLHDLPLGCNRLILAGLSHGSGHEWGAGGGSSVRSPDARCKTTALMSIFLGTEVPAISLCPRRVAHNGYATVNATWIVLSTADIPLLNSSRGECVNRSLHWGLFPTCHQEFKRPKWIKGDSIATPIDLPPRCLVTPPRELVRKQSPAKTTNHALRHSCHPPRHHRCGRSPSASGNPAPSS